MATCKECVYEPNCYSRIAHGMDTEWNGTPTKDMEKRCKRFKTVLQIVEEHKVKTNSAVKT